MVISASLDAERFMIPGKPGRCIMAAVTLSIEFTCLTTVAFVLIRVAMFRDSWPTFRNCKNPNVQEKKRSCTLLGVLLVGYCGAERRR